MSRGENGNGNGKSSKTKRRNQKRKNYLKKTKAENEELKQRIAALEARNADDDAEDESEPPSKKVTFNQRTGQMDKKTGNKK